MRACAATGRDPHRSGAADMREHSAGGACGSAWFIAQNIGCALAAIKRFTESKFVTETGFLLWIPSLSVKSECAYIAL